MNRHYPNRKLFNQFIMALALGSIGLHPAPAKATEPQIDNPDEVPITVVGRRNDNIINVVGHRISPDAEIRLYNVGYKLAVANDTKCDRPRMMTGLLVHDTSYYYGPARIIFQKDYGISYGFAIIAVVKGSSADVAGLKSGDQIIAYNGSDLSMFRADQLRKKSADPYRSLGFLYTLSEALIKGPVELTVRRSGQNLQIPLVGRLGCGGAVRIDHSEESENLDLGRNAWYDEISVGISKRLINFTQSDDELAFIVAHQMAHNLAGDYLKARHTLLSSYYGMSQEDHFSAEKSADFNAITMMQSASYDYHASIEFLIRARQAGWLSGPSTRQLLEERIVSARDYIETGAVAVRN